MQGSSSQVRVGVRIRPLTSKETSEGGESVVQCNAFDRTVELSKRKFTYDSVFHSNITQIELYNNVAPPLLQSFLNGYNATVLAYGQTGSGKTFTMGSEAGGNFDNNLQRDGNPSLQETSGLIPRFVQELFSSLIQRKELSEKKILSQSPTKEKTNNILPEQQQSVSLVDYKVSASFLEVYGDDIFDLLDDDRDVALKIREDSNKQVVIQGLKSAPISNAYEAMNVLNTGTMNRTTASTLMNLTSSRSHAVFQVDLQQTTRSTDGDELTTKSRFTFVDLAGSERMKKTGAEGDRAKEGIKINEGLLALGNCINALADEDKLAKGEKRHVPYRQSKLTRLLQDALGGNSTTLFLACVSPSDTNASETLSTLHYANRARNIKNAPTKNVDATAEELRRLRTLTNILKCELIKERFVEDENGDNSTDSTDIPQNIGVVSDVDILQRKDVIDYMKVIDDKAMSLSGTSANLTTFPTCSSTQSNNDDPNVTQQATRESSSIYDLAPNITEEEDDDDSDNDDINIDVEEDMNIIDELLQDNHQHEEQIDKIDVEIDEQEEKLVQLKKHILVYQDVKERYQVCLSEVQKLEVEKQALADKLEKAESDPKGSWIMTKLEQVKAKLSEARHEVRKQQQKCREAELEAQRCKGLERRIEEMKCIKANMIRKQKEDNKRQKDFSKTKAQEIKDLQRKERSASKRVLKLEAEVSRHKSALDHSKSRYDKLYKKLKETENNLKQARSTRRNTTTITNTTTNSINALPEQDNRQFAPMSPKVSSIKYLLQKTVVERVALSKNRVVYKSKVALRGNLSQRMADEVKLVNELKQQCHEIEGKPSTDILDDVIDHEDNVQDLLIQIELVEKSLEDLQAKYPSIDDDDEEEGGIADVFDEHDPSLKILSKLNGSVLRTLMLGCLGTCYSSELDRQSIKDKSNQKDLKCATLEDDVAVLNDKIKLLSKSLERHSSSPQNHIGVVDSNEKESLQKELERTRDKLSLVEEKYDKAETQISKLQAKQKQRESIEEQINTSVSNKDTLISELEKTALLKDVEKANKRCSKAEKELALALSKQEDMDSIKEQLACCLKELDRYKEKENQSSQVTADQLQEKKALKVETVTREGAVDDKPSSQQVNDTTITSPKAADTPSSKGKHSSTKFSKFDSLKNRYLKKVQSPEPRPIYPSK